MVRHGETEWNIGGIFRGRADIDLNGVGNRQARLLAEYLGDSKIDAICSSPLKRALRTAEIVASRHKLKVEIAPDVIDLDFGEWQGLTVQEVENKYKALYAEWVENPHKVKMPGGESLNDVRRRTTGVVNDIISRYKGTVILVSHRVVSKVMICALLGLDNSYFWNIRQDVAGITTFVYENERFILIGHNDTSHLKSIHKALPGDF